MSKNINSAEQADLANHEIVTVATYLLGGKTRRIDTEDIAVKANSLAPGRFSWRKYPEQINIDTVRKRLWDAANDRKGAYLSGSEKEGWMVTPAGVRFCLKATRLLTENPTETVQRLSRNETRWRTVEKERLMRTPAFEKFTEGAADTITRREAEQFFRLDDYVTGEHREQKIFRLLNAFGTDKVMGKLVSRLAEQIRSKE